MRLRTVSSWVTKEGKQRTIRWRQRYQSLRYTGNLPDGVETYADYREWAAAGNTSKRGRPHNPVNTKTWKTKSGKRRVIRLYAVWYNMRQRCSPSCTEKDYPNYYGKGIRVCQEWLDFDTFREWALANGYGKNLSIDRVDSDKGYCPENCEWVTLAENGRRAMEARYGT